MLSEMSLPRGVINHHHLCQRKIYRFEPPPPAPPLLIEESIEPEEPDSHCGLITFIIWLSIVFILGLAVIVWAYLAS